MVGGGCCKGRMCGGLRSGGAQWYRPTSLTELASVFTQATQSNKTVKLVCGDTGRGEGYNHIYRVASNHMVSMVLMLFTACQVYSRLLRALMYISTSRQFQSCTKWR